MSDDPKRWHDDADAPKHVRSLLRRAGTPAMPPEVRDALRAGIAMGVIAGATSAAGGGASPIAGATSAAGGASTTTVSATAATAATAAGAVATGAAAGAVATGAAATGGTGTSLGIVVVGLAVVGLAIVGVVASASRKEPAAASTPSASIARPSAEAPFVPPPGPSAAEAPSTSQAPPFGTANVLPAPATGSSALSDPRGCASGERGPHCLAPPSSAASPVVASAAQPAPSARRTASDSAESTASDLRAELDLIARARASDPNAALAAADEHARRFPNGSLAPERDYLRIRALARSARRDEAKAEARAFLAKYPTSPNASAVRAIVAELER